MKKLSFKEKLEIVRNIIRESLSGNAAFALLVYSLLHSLPIKTFADLFVAILLFIAIIAVVIWLFLIIYVYFCELFRSHWIAVWFILWSVVINLTIGFGIYDKLAGFAPIFPDTCYHLTHYWLAAVDIPVASDNPVHYADAIRYNARTPLQGSLLPLTRLVWA